MMRHIRIVLAFGVAAALMAFPVHADRLGEAIEALGTPRGVACVPDCNDGQAALKLARETEMLVLAMDDNLANVRAAKEKAADAGLLGRRLYVEQGSPEAIPFADNYVDLLVMPDVDELDLTNEVRAEIMRVLTPIRGRAVLADTTIQKPELPGSDWWTHKLHGPDNNQVSEDTAFEFPPIVQYRAMPPYSSYVGSALTADGIHVEINDWVWHNPERASLCGRIFARNSYNGRILWEGTVPAGIEPDMPLFAIARGDLLMASGERAEVLRRDLETGAERPGIVLGGEDTRIKWLAVEDGTLFALLGGPSVLRTPFNWLSQGKVFEKQEREQTLFGSVLIAWDMNGGDVLWKHREPAGIDFRAVAVHRRKLYFYAEKSRLACLDAQSGRPLWENADEHWVGSIRRPDRIRNTNIRYASTLKAADGLVHLALMEGSKAFLFRAEDGALLHTIEHPRGRTYTGQKSLILDGKCYLGANALDPETGWWGSGDALPSPAGTAWCGVATYAPGSGVIGHSTLCYKAPCGVGAWVAGGILLYGPTICTCSDHFMGAGAYAGGGGIYARIESSPEHPLVKGEAFGTASSLPSPAQEDDWPTYRGDNRRRGSSPAGVNGRAEVVWTSVPQAPFEYTKLYNQCVAEFDERPVPPICTGGLVYSAGTDGIVRAHDLSDGDIVWTYHADGPVFTSPACEGGRLFVPGADGWVNALDAGTGKVIWKRRIAPLERRISVFGNLMSTWPVFSLAVEGGTVYASAGMSIICGSTTLALDAETGEVLWRRAIEPTIAGSHYPPSGAAVGFGGNMAIVGDALWTAGYGSLPLCLSRTDGAVAPQPDAVERFRREGNYWNFRCIYYMQGQNLVAVDENCVLAGGGALLENHQLREGKNRRIGYKMYFADDRGLMDLGQAPARILNVARVAPACDDELVAFAAPSASDKRGRLLSRTSLATRGLRVWKTPDFTAESRAMKLKNPLEENVVWKDVVRPRDDDKALWQKPELDVSAIALASDAVLVAHGVGVTDLWDRSPAEFAQHSPLIQYEGWALTAFERGGGKELWSVGLPSEPLYNGIAIAADGSVIVTLRDGSLICVGEG